MLSSLRLRSHTVRILPTMTDGLGGVTDGLAALELDLGPVPSRAREPQAASV
jgi:hypothetical protein